MQRIYQVMLVFIVVFFACKQKSKPLDGDAPVKISDLVAAYPVLKLPYQVSDTNLQRRSDTTAISYKVLAQFVPDTVLSDFATAVKDEKKLRIRPVGRIEKANGNYLLTNFTQNKRTILGVFYFNKKNQFLSGMEVLRSHYNDDYSHTMTINQEPTFIISRELMTKGQLQYTRNGFALNEATNEFMKVINESNEDQKKANEILNPIDTFARKNKWSGDYTADKKNFISIRDGKSASNYLFFIHFEKNGGQCTGELKGELNLQGEKKAIFRQNGDPCVIDFSFDTNSVAVKEQGSCGNHRGMRCLFNDTYRRKKKR